MNRLYELHADADANIFRAVDFSAGRVARAYGKLRRIEGKPQFLPQTATDRTAGRVCGFFPCGLPFAVYNIKRVK